MDGILQQIPVPEDAGTTSLRTARSFSRPFNLAAEEADRLGERLINRFVKPDNVVQCGCTPPLSRHSRSTAARNARYLAHSWLISKPRRARRTAWIWVAVFPRPGCGRKTSRFIDLRLARLWRCQVFGDRLEDLAGMVA